MNSNKLLTLLKFLNDEIPTLVTQINDNNTILYIYDGFGLPRDKWALIALVTLDNGYTVKVNPITVTPGVSEVNLTTYSLLFDNLYKFFNGDIDSEN
jgi:hypothetical protein